MKTINRKGRKDLRTAFCPPWGGWGVKTWKKEYNTNDLCHLTMQNTLLARLMAFVVQ